jgi:hypothetical protein
MQRLETAPSSSSDKLNMDRYNADKPSNADEQSEQVLQPRKLRFFVVFILVCVQAWRGAVENIKAQLEHQENRLMNAEVAELHLSAVWLQNNTTTEQLTKKYIADSEAMNRQIREINKARQVLQTKAYPELSKLVHKRNLALQRKWSCQLAHEQIKQDLLGKAAKLFAA